MRRTDCQLPIANCQAAMPGAYSRVVGKDASHRVPVSHFQEELRDAVERVPTIPKTRECTRMPETWGWRIRT